MRINFITIVIWSLFLGMAFPSISKPHASNKNKPNIILIVSDDQGIADAGFSGSPDILTPHIDKIANEGVIFNQGYVSHSYCSPSRAGILTGKYQQRFGHELNPPYEPENEMIGLPFDEVLISDELKKAGYCTGAIGKWHLGHHPMNIPINRDKKANFKNIQSMLW